MAVYRGIRSVNVTNLRRWEVYYSGVKVEVEEFYVENPDTGDLQRVKIYYCSNVNDQHRRGNVMLRLNFRFFAVSFILLYAGSILVETFKYIYWKERGVRELS